MKIYITVLFMVFLLGAMVFNGVQLVIKTAIDSIPSIQAVK